MTDKFTHKIFKRRLDCLIYFDLIVYGWGELTYNPNGHKVMINSPVSKDPRLGYPTRYQLLEAFYRVRKACPEETTEYKAAYFRWKVARNRHYASKTKARWDWYVWGQGNSMALAVRSHIAIWRKTDEKEYRKRYRYYTAELLPRKSEGKRAKREMREEAALLEVYRNLIFEKMGVPGEYRNKVLSI